MTLSISFIESSERRIKINRHGNLRFLNEQYGHGFQKTLLDLLNDNGTRYAQSTISNLVNAAPEAVREAKSEFTTRIARDVERALDLPLSCLDLPSWHFQLNIELFWQYAERASSDRAWFDALLNSLLIEPAEEIKKHNLSSIASPALVRLIKQVQDSHQKKIELTKSRTLPP